MSTLERYQAFLVLIAVLAGLAMSQLDGVKENAGLLVAPSLVLMLVVVFLHTPLREMGDALSNRKFSITALLTNFLWTPLFGWFLGSLFLSDQPDLRVGLIMLIVTPCTDWYLVFTQMAKGNVKLATSLLPWHLLLQLCLLPIYLWIMAGDIVPLDGKMLIETVLLMLALPLGIAWLIRTAARASRGDIWLENHLLPKTAGLQILFLLTAITAMFASQGNALVEQSTILWQILPPLLCFYIGTLALGMYISRRLEFTYPDCAAFCFSTLAKNSPISLAIAVIAFPDKPLIALALAVEPLIELPIMAILPTFFNRFIRPVWSPPT